MNNTAGADLAREIAVELTQDVPVGVHAIATEIRRRFGEPVAAILFYGSCLRARSSEGVLDFYVLVDSYRAVYDSRLMAAVNTALPPNVFFIAIADGGCTFRAKVAVVSLDQFATAVSRRSLQTSIWARFAQPAALVYARDATIARRVATMLGDAVVTAVARIAPLLPAKITSAELWTGVFRATFGAELRAESADRPRQIYEAAGDRYDRLTLPALRRADIPFEAPGPDGRIGIRIGSGARWRARQAWRARVVLGKILSLARLVKGVFTFDGGVDYICWKIERHSGVRPRLSPWERRHPVLALPVLLVRLYRQGAFR